MTRSRTSLRSAESHEQAWGHLLKFLTPNSSHKSDEEVAARYLRASTGTESPRTSAERDALSTLRLMFIDSIYSVLEKTQLKLNELGLSANLPRVNSIVAREEFFRVRHDSLHPEYSLLGEIRDTDGRSIVWRDGILSYPTRNSLMFRIRSRCPARGEFDYEVLFSRAAFNEEMEVNRLLVEPFSKSILSRPLVPLSFRCIADAAFDALGIPLQPSLIDEVEVLERSAREPPAFIVSIAGKRCVVRLSLRADLPFPLTRTTLLG